MPRCPQTSATAVPLCACWGGAYAALKQLSGVATVRPLADAKTSVAFVYLDHDGLPDIGKWPAQFARSANGSYVWRGVEVTMSGVLRHDGGLVSLPGTPARPRVVLAPLQRSDKVQIDQENGVPKPLPADEAEAYARLVAHAKSANADAMWSVSGPLKQSAEGFELEVRRFHQTPVSSSQIS